MQNTWQNVGSVLPSYIKVCFGDNPLKNFISIIKSRQSVLDHGKPFSPLNKRRSQGRASTVEEQRQGLQDCRTALLAGTSPLWTHTLGPQPSIWSSPAGKRGPRALQVKWEPKGTAPFSPQ